jgi:hypothetical protein
MRIIMETLMDNNKKIYLIILMIYDDENLVNIKLEYKYIIQL